MMVRLYRCQRSRICLRRVIILTPRHFSISNPVWLFGVPTEPLLAISFVFAVVPVEPCHSAVALEREDVGSNTVQKPSIVAADDGASTEPLQAFFQGAQRIHVQIVCRLIQD